MRKIALLLLSVFMLGVTLPAFASPFSDLPADHWATQAVKVLAEKGLVEGYPNGTFKGDRAATRYEVAMIVARLVAYLEKQKPQVTKEDLDAIRQLVDEYKEELDAMGVRLKNVEDTLANLEGRVKKLEAIKVSGGFETRFVANQASTCAGCVMTPFQFDATAIATRNPIGDQNALWNHTDVHNPDREKPILEQEGYPFDRVYTAFPTRTGTALTEQGYLAVTAKLSDAYNAGGVVSLYNDQGQLGDGYIFGANPNTIANPFQAGSASSPAATLLGSTSTNLSANLNQLFVTSNKQNMNVVLGDWRPAYIPDFMLQGLPNMSLFGPDYLPFYGGQIYGQLNGNGGSGLIYEGAAGRLPGLVNAAGLVPAQLTSYQNLVFGGALGYEWKNSDSTLADVKLVGSYVRALNDPATTSPGTTRGVDAPGLWTLNNGVLSFPLGVGPQSINLYGGELSAQFGKGLSWLSAWIKYGQSNYIESTGVASTFGSMADGGINVGAGGKVSGGAEYLWVQPNYDPFLSEISVPTAAFAGPNPAVVWMGFPYPVSYGPPFTTGAPLGNPFVPGGFTGQTAGGGDVFYNLHDARQYPNNRTGFRLWANWNYGYGHVGGGYENLQQTVVSSLSAESGAGFYEPLFYTTPTGPNGLAQPSASNPSRGVIRTWKAYGDFTTPSKALTIDGDFWFSRILRPEYDFNNIDLNFTFWRAGVTYRPAEKWSLLAGYDQLISCGSERYFRPVVNPFNGTITIPGAAGPIPIVAGGVVPKNFAFRQEGPYFGVNFAFTKASSAWMMYRVDDLIDTNQTGFSGFSGRQFQSGLRFTF